MQRNLFTVQFHSFEKLFIYGALPAMLHSRLLYTVSSKIFVSPFSWLMLYAARKSNIYLYGKFCVQDWKSSLLILNVHICPFQTNMLISASLLAPFWGHFSRCHGGHGISYKTLGLTLSKLGTGCLLLYHG